MPVNDEAGSCCILFSVELQLSVNFAVLGRVVLRWYRIDVLKVSALVLVRRDKISPNVVVQCICIVVSLGIWIDVVIITRRL